MRALEVQHADSGESITSVFLLVPTRREPQEPTLRTFIRPNGMEATTLIGSRVMDPIGEIPADLLQHNSKGLVCMIWQPDRRHLPGQENDAKWTYSRVWK